MYINNNVGDYLDFIKAYTKIKEEEKKKLGTPSIALTVVYGVLFSIPLLLLLGKYTDVKLPFTEGK